VIKTYVESFLFILGSILGKIHYLVHYLQSSMSYPIHQCAQRYLPFHDAIQFHLSRHYLEQLSSNLNRIQVRSLFILSYYPCIPRSILSISSDENETISRLALSSCEKKNCFQWTMLTGQQPLFMDSAQA
jgi:hypothetical protein